MLVIYSSSKLAVVCIFSHKVRSNLVLEFHLDGSSSTGRGIKLSPYFLAISSCLECQIFEAESLNLIFIALTQLCRTLELEFNGKS